MTERNIPNGTAGERKRDASSNPFASLEAELLLRTASRSIASTSKKSARISMNSSNAVKECSAISDTQASLRNQPSFSQGIRPFQSTTSSGGSSLRRIPIQESIVGFRPKHWSTPSNTHPTHRRTTKRRSGVRERESILTMENVKNKELSPALRPEDALLGTHSTATEDPLPLSYKPRFFSTQSHAATAMETDDHDFAAIQNSDNLALDPPPTEVDGTLIHTMWRPTWFEDRHSVSSPVASKRSKGSSSEPGPLLKRLQAIRQSIQGDVVRLSSGQYPFSLRQVDRNDPRNRASTIMDVTILGNPSPLREQHLVTLPCFVHQWMKVSLNSDRSFQPVDIQKRHVSIMFTCDTIQDHGIVCGSQLRLYNAIYIPVHEQSDSRPQPGGDSANIPISPKADGVIVCTQLCEPYPTSFLPPLVLPNSTAR